MADVTPTETIAGLLEPLFLTMLREGASDPVAAEASMVSLLMECGRTAYASALEDWDLELCATLPGGTRVHDRRRRTIATRLGDVTFSRRTCRDRLGNPAVPLDEALDLAAGARVSPALEELLVWLAAGDSYQRAADTAERTGSSGVSAACVMACVHRAGMACREEDERAAESMFVDGVKPAGEVACEELRVESDGTVVRLQHEGGDRLCEVKGMVAYAGKRHAGEDGRARKVRRVRPVSFGCVGTPREMWTEGLAAVGSVYDVTKVRVVHSGFDGAGWCVGGSGYMGFAQEVVGHLDPFHVSRAVSACFDAGHGDGRLEAMRKVYEGDAAGCADALERMAEEGSARATVVARVAPYLRNHASEIGADGPSLGTMEAENQHVYKSRMASVPCAWTREGADSMARIRSRRASGREIPRLDREHRTTDAARRRRQERVDAALPRAVPGASSVAMSEGKGYDYPVQASTSGMRADVRYESGLTADHRLR